MRTLFDTHKTSIVLLLSIVAITLGIIVLYQLTYQSSGDEIVFVDNTYSDEITRKQLSVDVRGEVKKPGVYTFEPGSIVDDAIKQAGGITKEADNQYVAEHINRAKQLIDGEKIFIPKEGQSAQTLGSTSTSKTVNINTASKNKLETLPGIGPSYAEKIIGGRPYARIEDLKNVSGIGDATFEKLKDLISV